MLAVVETNFTAIDWSIVAVYLAGSIAVGVWANRYVGNLADYLVAGRTLRIRLALATMTGTELGLVTVMYMSQLGFTQQYAALYLAVLECVALLILGATGFVVTRLRATSVLTIPEYYERRYSRGVRIVGATVMVLAGVLNMGLFLNAGSQFVAAVTGFADEVYLKWIMTALLLLVLLYTVLGGMISVVITDLIQFIVLGVGMLIVTYLAVRTIGFETLTGLANQPDGYVDPTLTANPSLLQQLSDAAVRPAGVGWLQITTQAAVIFTASMLWPAVAMRTLSVKSPQVARRLFLWSAVPFLARRAIPVLWGVCAYIYFFHLGGGERAGQMLEAIDRGEYSSLSAMPLFLGAVIPTGLLGLISAGMIAAFMSTHDSYLLCWSGVISQDIVDPLCGPLSERARILVTRISIVLIGVFLLVWSLWYPLAGNMWGYMAITGTIYLAGVLPLIVGGLYWSKASRTGAYAALATGLLAIFALEPGVRFLQSSVWEGIRDGHVTLLTFLLAVAAFIGGSLLFPEKREA